MKRLLGSLALLLFVAARADGPDSHPVDFNLPEPITACLEKLPGRDGYRVRADINPIYQRGEFTGDQALDYAYFIVNKKSNKAGILICSGKSSDKPVLLGAGRKFGPEAEDDFSWADTWRVFVSREFTPFDAEPANQAIHFHSEGIEVFKNEGAGWIIYWDGKRYAIVYTGD